MSAREADSLWLKLKAAGVVAGDQPPAGASLAPWSVRAMGGVGGWIGALFLLGFLSLALEPAIRSGAAAFVVGALACAGAWMLFRAKPESDFATQFALAVSLSGQGLVLVALFDELGTRSMVALGMCLFQAVLFVTIPNFVHRVWSAWTGVYAILIVLADWHLQPYVPGLLSVALAAIWLNEFRYARHGTMLRAGGYGVVLALFTSGTGVLNLGDSPWRAGIVHPPQYHLWIGAGLGGVALMWSVWRLLKREGVEPASSAGGRLLAGAGILALAALKAPGLAPAILILLLGYANGNRILVGLGIAALLSYLSLYYFSLETTLLNKSALMVAAGLALLAARFLLRHWWPTPLTKEHGHA